MPKPTANLKEVSGPIEEAVQAALAKTVMKDEKDVVDDIARNVRVYFESFEDRLK